MVTALRLRSKDCHFATLALGIQGAFLEMAFPKQPFLNCHSLPDKNRKLGNLSKASALHKLAKPANLSSHPLGGIRSTSKSSTCNSRFWTCGSRSGPVFQARVTMLHTTFREQAFAFSGHDFGSWHAVTTHGHLAYFGRHQAGMYFMRRHTPNEGPELCDPKRLVLEIVGFPLNPSCSKTWWGYRHRSLAAQS